MRGLIDIECRVHAFSSQLSVPCLTSLTTSTQVSPVGVNGLVSEGAGRALFTVLPLVLRQVVPCIAHWISEVRTFNVVLLAVGAVDVEA